MMQGYSTVFFTFNAVGDNHSPMDTDPAGYGWNKITVAMLAESS